MSQAREVGGWISAEAQGSTLVRVISITPASVAAGAAAQQAFAMVGMLAADIVVQSQPATQGQTSGVVSTPGATTAAGQLGINFAAALGTATATAVAPVVGVYNILYFRR